MKLVRSQFVLFLVVMILPGCLASRQSIKGNDMPVVAESHVISAGVQKPVPGIPAYQDSQFGYQRKGEKIFSVHLKAPIVVSAATKPEKWGYFQFPSILQKDDSGIAIKWNLTIDAIEAYGSPHFGSAVSHDGGVSWQLTGVEESSGGLLLANGDKINVVTPKPIKVEELQLPAPIGKGNDPYVKSAYTFYKHDDLPESRRGIYLERLKKGSNTWVQEKDSLYDPRAARYTFKGLFPVLWWGDMHLAKDQSAIAGVYPGFFINDNGVADPRSGIFFYRSTDNGHTWNIQGRIMYVPDLRLDSTGYKRTGFTEPAFELAPNGSFVAVMRTTDGLGNGPMYGSHSTDLGVTWTKPEIIACSGVYPRLLRLANGVTVLASGRPGVQLRFSTDGEGKNWSDPFELLPYANEKDEVSCGYTGLLATGPDRFLIVYSDFRYENEAKEIRKAIKVREVIVQKGF